MSNEWSFDDGFIVVDTGSGRAYVYYSDGSWKADDPDGNLLKYPFSSPEMAMNEVNKEYGINAEYDAPALKYEMKRYLLRSIHKLIDNMKHESIDLYQSLDHLSGLVDERLSDDIAELEKYARDCSHDLRMRLSRFDNIFVIGDTE